jgi:hypothetical protein
MIENYLEVSFHSVSLHLKGVLIVVGWGWSFSCLKGESCPRI